MKRLLCIYHGNCADGFGAAWVVRRALREKGVEFCPGIYQTPPGVSVAGRDVVIVDFSYKRPVILEMAKTAKSILIIDHHKSAAEDLADIAQDAAKANLCPITTTFNMNQSGAVLTWKHYFPRKATPWLLLHIEDRDLWTFAMPGTREVQAAVFSYPYEFKLYDQWMNGTLLHQHTVLKTLAAEGKIIERKHHKDIKELLGVVQRRMTIGGYNVPVANLPYTMVSDAAHLMTQGEAFAACYWDTPTGRTFGLRSTELGVDVSRVAVGYGGGGHRNSAGFTVSYDHELTK